ncbi:MAG: hypothetical protein J6K29_02290 [Clostridia bacterium]|nr:hypothetical protein [Clostridia bacterium]
MKQHLLILIFLSVCFAVFSGCAMPEAGKNEIPAAQGWTVIDLASNFPAEPPNLQVSDGTATVTAWRGTCSWLLENDDGTGSGINTDTMHPLDCTDAIPSLKMAKRGTLTFSFIEPPTTVIVRRYRLKRSDYDAYEEIPVKSGSIEVKSGNFLYEVIARWDHPEKPYGGTVYYAFSTEK